MGICNCRSECRIAASRRASQFHLACSDRSYFEQGKAQLANYLHSEGLDEGYYVVFSNRHTDQDTLYSDEMVQGKRIVTWIIRTDFKAASRRVAQRQRRNRE